VGTELARTDITGVPQAIASIMASPNGSSNVTRGRRAGWLVTKSVDGRQEGRPDESRPGKRQEVEVVVEEVETIRLLHGPGDVERLVQSELEPER
jgi:hypothetical protein